MRNILIYACIGLWVLFLTSIIYGCNPAADCNREYNEEIRKANRLPDGPERRAALMVAERHRMDCLNE